MQAYLDNNATTPLAPEVLEAMMPYLRERFGNPSSFHTFGSAVMEDLEEARSRVAALLGASDPTSVVFTGGGTESDNWALRGAVAARPDRPALVTTAVEHPAVLETARDLERAGHPLRIAGVTCDGRLDMEDLMRFIDGDVAVVSVMAANNETGVIMPVAECAAAASRAGALFHTDAVQAAGKIPLDVESSGIDLLSLSAHKIHGPKGVGALYIRPGVEIAPLVTGGHHEKGRRAGTYNAPGIAGFGEAARLALADMEAERARLSSLRDRFEREVLAGCPGAIVAGSGAERLPNTTTVLFKGVESEAILTLLDMRGISASSGSACSTGSRDPSHVLKAMNIDRNLANSALRFSLGRYTTDAEIDYAVGTLVGIVDRLRRISPYA